jgi:hypothetical protein
MLPPAEDSPPAKGADMALRSNSMSLHTDPLPDAVLRAIASAVADLLPEVMEKSSGRPVEIELRETFAVLLLEAAALRAWDREHMPARRTNRWHHQIWQQGKGIIGWARSIPMGPGPKDWAVRELYVEDGGRPRLAGMIDSAIPELDDRFERKGQDYTVRLLQAPAYQLHAFWLCSNAGVGSDYVWPISCGIEGVVVGKEQKAIDFLSSLRERAHVVGIAY